MGNGQFATIQKLHNVRINREDSYSNRTPYIKSYRHGNIKSYKVYSLITEKLNLEISHRNILETFPIINKKLASFKIIQICQKIRRVF